MIQYVKSKKGYFYKIGKNGEKKRISKNVYYRKTMKRQKGGGYKINKYENGISPQDAALSEISQSCLPYYDEEMVKGILVDKEHDVYTFNDGDNRCVGFMCIDDKNYTCDEDCFDCDKKPCVYILLLCIKKEARGKGVLKLFFDTMCDIFRSEGKICIRLTASHSKVLFAYLGLGFEVDPVSYNKVSCGMKLVYYL